MGGEVATSLWVEVEQDQRVKPARAVPVDLLGWGAGSETGVREREGDRPSEPVVHQAEEPGRGGEDARVRVGPPGVSGAFRGEPHRHVRRGRERVADDEQDHAAVSLERFQDRGLGLEERPVEGVYGASDRPFQPREGPRGGDRRVLLGEHLVRRTEHGQRALGEAPLVIEPEPDEPQLAHRVRCRGYPRTAITGQGAARNSSSRKRRVRSGPPDWSASSPTMRRPKRSRAAAWRISSGRRCRTPRSPAGMNERLRVIGVPRGPFPSGLTNPSDSSRPGTERERDHRGARVPHGDLLGDRGHGRGRHLAERRQKDPRDPVGRQCEPVEDEHVRARVVEDVGRGVPDERVSAPPVAAQREKDRVDAVRLGAFEDLARDVRRRPDLGVDLDVKRGSGFVGRHDQVDRLAPLPRDRGQRRRRDHVQDTDLAVGLEQHRGEPDERLDLGGFLNRDEDLSVHGYRPISGRRARSRSRTSTYGTPT